MVNASFQWCAIDGGGFHSNNIYSILIAKSLIRRLQNNGPIIETQALYQWLMPHFSGVRLTVAVFIRISTTIDTLFIHNSQIHVN
ncbi:hypothetical protein T03_14781 [Trichinella britovi]|uniref:Uncharacterized protein n=2 Tax=Trichinella TaxID=6333 RepID=A0A0V1DI60_TRIBR|nr:hypothetical protein T03_14781 [Trichinella britovi]